ncbi:MAG TPA: hypothetical protein VFE18_14250 [Phenylobacterium sp.]|jgi:hypothetical protein|uniref:hypothetical protein n=1 Tax=Phenylobacterium sp. TaxID=1871053 RepID=UPI002D6BFB4A|nr:hypothetical protein [Phenylobacterium sp.]HZZ69331.1 hypothetical protein [Phenylobacterium sp.]
MKIVSTSLRIALALAAALLVAGPAMAQTYDGDWAGALSAGGQTLRLELHLKTAGGATTGELNSLDQDTTIPVTAVKTEGGELSVLFLPINAELRAKLSPDGKTLTGAWNQGAALPLTLTKK